MQDAIANITDAIRQAAAQAQPLIIQGGGSKTFYGNPSSGQPLDMSALSGIIDYEPSELFIAAGAATPLATIESQLAKNGQMLGFEPPYFSPQATIGGTLACGLSGPRRPSAGALRDHVLGVSIIDGNGQLLNFGGKVIKNVAGFDVSRLMAGAMGTLGALTQVIFRVAPCYDAEITLMMEQAADDAILADNKMLAKGLPLTGGACYNGCVWRRFSGTRPSLQRTIAEVGGELLTDEAHQQFWHAIKEQTHSFFAGDDDLWKVVAPATMPVGDGDWLIEWHGAVRWRRGNANAVKEFAKTSGGAAALFRAADKKTANRFAPPPPTLVKIYRGIKKAFDAKRIFNRGRLYEFIDE